MTTTSSIVQTVTLEVAGMTCGSCERHIKKELDQVPGYQEARVGLAEGRVWVTYDSSTTDPAELVDAVIRAGYPAVVAADEAPAPAPRTSSCSCCAPKSL